MTISILAIVIWAGVAVFACLIPYNRAKELFLALLFPFAILAVFWGLDRFLFDFSAIKITGQAIVLLIPWVFAPFDATATGIATNAGVLTVGVSFLLGLAVSALTVNQSVIGVPPWKYSTAKVLLRTFYAIATIIIFGATLSYFVAGTRNLYYVRTGLMDGLFEFIFPFERCFV